MKKRSNEERSNYMLAVLSCIINAQFTPVQAQKIFFLLDRNISKKLGGNYFNFEPYHYGPFDKNVYIGLNTLVGSKDLISEYAGVRYYSLTANGTKKGKETFKSFDKAIQDYIKEVCNFVISLSFEQLLKAIYKEYPDMKVNSIFHP